ncbi:MAG: hypothetical protein Q7R81_07520 [Candidatus Peregrinibacteria bacterium]|nr:hypothetical protein [Candidatus Peregrinibacteria bacterium]
MHQACRQCQTSFEITEDDLAFYEKISPVFDGKKQSVPPPTLCPDCRMLRRFAFRNERNLYRRKSDATGKEIISVYSQEKPYKIFEADAWWNEANGPFVHGRDVDFDRPFFEQMQELLLALPHIALYNVQCENSPYVNQCGWSKNCHMAVATDFSEDCYYTEYSYSARNCVDSIGLHECELCYECVDCVQCYQTLFSQSCSTCTDCSFCFECRGCKHCFGCAGLRTKEHCYFNEQLTPEEWKKRVGTLTYTPMMLAENRERARVVKLKIPHPHAVMTNCVDCTGNYLSNCKNAIACFDGKDTQDSKYCSIMPLTTKDAYDLIGGGGELLYEVFSTGPGYHNIFCWHCWNGVSELTYCAFCMNASKNLFGCVGLKKQQYCIMNKQYSQGEYERMATKLAEAMRSRGEWGEFFPITLSPFAYNETIELQHFPLSRVQALKQGYHWRDEEDDVPKVEKIVEGSELPENIRDVPDDILNWAIRCEASGRPFRLIKQELDFYRTQGLPPPRLHPDERHNRRVALRNPRKLWKRQCDNCKKDIETTYAPERPEIVYCEECYLKEVY